MLALRNVGSLSRLVWRRTRSRLGISLAVLAGLCLAIGLVVSIPIYAEATGYRILLSRLAEHTEDQLPPFSLVYRYEGSAGPSIPWPRYREVDRVAANLRAAGIDLPSTRVVRYAATEQLRVLLPGADPSSFEEVPLARAAFLTGLDGNIQLVDGALPKPYTGSGPVEVLVSERAASANAYIVGDLYDVRTTFGTAYDLDLKARVAGVWAPANPETDYWFYPPDTFDGMLLMPEASFASLFGDPSVPWVKYAAWYTALDSSSVRSGAVARLRGRIDGVTGRVRALLPGSELSRSPVEALEQHRTQVRLLSVTLGLFAVPLLGLVWLFVAQVAGMLVESRRQEAALMRSRGSSRGEVVGLALLDALVLGAAAVAGGLALGLGTAQVMVWTQSFLRIAPRPGPPVGLLPNSLAQALFVLALALPAVLLPAFASSSYTIVSYKRERGRATRRPLWKRAYVDLVLLALALYGYQQLRARGGVGIPGVAAAQEDPWRNPVLILAPALLVLSLSLLLLRLLPLLLGALNRLFARGRGAAALMLRYLSRDVEAYSVPVLLMALTLSLAAFTSSVARTMDTQTQTRARYGSGADVRLEYKPEPPQNAGSAGGAASGGANTGPVPAAGAEAILEELEGTALGAEAAPAETEESLATAGAIDYLLLPVDDYLDVPGVRAVSRVAPSEVSVGPAGEPVQQGATLLGVDRATIGAVLEESWRPEYGEPLGALLNRLAVDPSAVLVSSGYVREHGLKIGDRLSVEMNDLGTGVDVPYTIAGVLDYFPTLYPESGPFLVGNLEYGFEQQGGTYLYQIWLDLAPGARLDEVRSYAFGFDLQVMPGTPRELVSADLARPERQGLLGLLSAGFLGAALVTAVGFLAHTVLSFRRRLVEMGILRAIGLSNRQLAALLVGEQALVIGAGAGAGAALGVLASRLFVPFMRVRSGDHPDTPPFAVEIAWAQLVWAGAFTIGLLAVTVGAVLLMMRGMRIFAAVKLGETV